MFYPRTMAFAAGVVLACLTPAHAQDKEITLGFAQ